MTMITLKEAVEILVKNEVLGEETKQKEQAVKRLLHQNLILGERPPKNQPKLGWKVDVLSLQEYIQVGNLKKQDMMQELIELRRRVVVLEHALETGTQPSSVHPKNELEEQEEKSEGKETVEEVKIENSPILEEQKFDFEHVKVTYPKKPERIEDNRYAVEFKLNGTPFTAVLEKSKKGLSLVEAKSEDDAIAVTIDMPYFEEVERALIPKVEKKIK